MQTPVFCFDFVFQCIHVNVERYDAQTRNDQLRFLIGASNNFLPYTAASYINYNIFAVSEKAIQAKTRTLRLFKATLTKNLGVFALVGSGKAFVKERG